VGPMGHTPQDILRCFWKYHSISHELDALSRQLSVLHDADIDLTREFTERAHLRSYRPGERIFSQGCPRQFLYVLTLGECQYTRSYPEPTQTQTSTVVPAAPPAVIPAPTSTSAAVATGNQAMSMGNQGSVEINLGLVLSAGHFSFMDGSLENEIKFREGQDDRVKKGRTIVKEDRSAKYYEMLCEDTTQLYWGRDLWHIHTLLSLDDKDKERIISKRRRFIEEPLSSRKSQGKEKKQEQQQQEEDATPPDDVCVTSIGLFGNHPNSLVGLTPFPSLSLSLLLPVV
jgi:hypothetical protein